MGVEHAITLSLKVCNETGRLYYTNYLPDTDEEEKIYDIATVAIPKDLLRYVSGYSHHMFPYIWRFIDQQEKSCSVSVFLHSFPAWDDIKDQTWNLHNWSEEDHNRFKELLTLYQGSGMPFQIQWWRPEK